MSRAKLNGLFTLAKEMRKQRAITSEEYHRIVAKLKQINKKIGGRS
jgi:hypothetical protein